MPKVMKTLAAVTFSLFVIFCVLYILDFGWALTPAITFATTAYHFIMRLAVGKLIDAVMHNKADYAKKWYQLRESEQRFYKLINIRKWKNNMPTYSPELFSPSLHTWHEIAQAMCQAEIVHETIVLLSFLPVFASIFFGETAVFIITSICAALYDLLFVMMQRYNRPRVIRLAMHEMNTTKKAPDDL